MNYNTHRLIICLVILGCIVFLAFGLTRDLSPKVVDTGEPVTISNNVENTDKVYDLQDARRLYIIHRFAR